MGIWILAIKFGAKLGNVVKSTSFPWNLILIIAVLLTKISEKRCFLLKSSIYECSSTRSTIFSKVVGMNWMTKCLSSAGPIKES